MSYCRLFAAFLLLCLGFGSRFAPAQATFTLSGTNLVDTDGTPLQRGKLCFGQTCLRITGGTASGYATQGTSALQVLNASGTSVFLAPAVPISTSAFNFDGLSFTLAAGQTATGQLQPYFQCQTTATYVQNYDNSHFTCRSNAWVKDSSLAVQASGQYSGPGLPTFYCIAPCTWTQTDAATPAASLFTLLANPGATSNNWQLQGGTGGGGSAPGGVVNALQFKKDGTSTDGGAAYYVKDASSGGTGVVVGGDGTDSANGGPDNTFLNIIGNQFPQLNFHNLAAPGGLGRSRVIIRPDGSFQIQMQHDDNTDGDSVIYAQRNGDGSIGTESLQGNVRLGGGATGQLNCDIFSTNPTTVHAQFGINTCFPYYVYGINHQGDSTIQSFDPQGNDAYFFAHTQGSGIPHFFMWGEQLNGAYDTHIDQNGNYLVDNVAGPGTHHTSILCNNFGSTAGTPLACRFPYGYDGVFSQNGANPFSNNVQWAGMEMNSYWSTSANDAVSGATGQGSTGQPNYGSATFGGSFFGGYNEFNSMIGHFFKSNVFGVGGTWTWAGMGQHQMNPWLANIWGEGDGITGEHTINHHGGGNENAAEQIHGDKYLLDEDPYTAIGTCSGSGCTLGSNTFGLTPGFALNTLGEGHDFADLSTAVVSPGYLLPAQGQDPITGLQINAIAGDAFPVSQMFLIAGDIQAAANSTAPGLVTFAIQTTNLPSPYLADTSTLPATGLGCTWDPRGEAGQKGARYTKIDATHIQANLAIPLSAGSAFFANGMCDKGLDPTADQVTPQGGNMPLHAIAGVYASISSTQVLTTASTQLGTNSLGRGELVASVNVSNYSRVGGVASFTLQGSQPDQLDGLTVQVVGNDTNVAGVSYVLQLTTVGALKSGLANFTAVDTRPTYQPAGGVVQAAMTFNNAQFSTVDIAEAVDVRDVNHLVVRDNNMRLAPGDTIIQTHTETQANGGASLNEFITFSPRANNPIDHVGCDEGGLIGSFMSAGDSCFSAVNETAPSMYLGYGGTRGIPGAQFKQTGLHLGAADWELARGGTGIRISRPGGIPLSKWGPVTVIDLDGSLGVANQINYVPSLGAQYGRLLFGNMHVELGSIFTPILNVGTDGAPIVTVLASTGQGTYTTAAPYAAQPVCTGGATTLGAPVNFGGLGQSWAQTDGRWILTVTAGTKPPVDTQVPFVCVEPGSTYLN